MHHHFLQIHCQLSCCIFDTFSALPCLSKLNYKIRLPCIICIEFDVAVYNNSREHSRSIHNYPDVNLRAWLENTQIWNISNAPPMNFSIIWDSNRGNNCQDYIILNCQKVYWSLSKQGYSRILNTSMATELAPLESSDCITFYMYICIPVVSLLQKKWIKIASATNTRCVCLKSWVKYHQSTLNAMWENLIF